MKKDNNHLWFAEYEKLCKKYTKTYDCCDDERIALMVVALMNCEKRKVKRMMKKEVKNGC